VSDRTLAVEARLESLSEVGRWLAEAAREEGLPYDVAFGLDLALHEAVENVVRHGCGDGAAHTIQISIRRGEQRVEVVVEDDGLAFDPTSVPPPPVPQRLEDVIPGGQGINLMRYFTDEMLYRRKEGRNVLVLARRLPSRSG
jgi:anti-sigma regulatory factor (Ser/Thr protein kinase)